MTDAGLTAATTTSGVASSCGQIKKSLAFVLLPVVHSEQVAWCFPLEFQSSSQPLSLADQQDQWLACLL
jgi:hypothetical protein